MPSERTERFTGFPWRMCSHTYRRCVTSSSSFAEPDQKAILRANFRRQVRLAPTVVRTGAERNCTALRGRFLRHLVAFDTAREGVSRIASDSCSETAEPPNLVGNWGVRK